MSKTEKSDVHRSGWQILGEVRAEIPKFFPETVAEAILNGLKVQAEHLGRGLSTG